MSNTRKIIQLSSAASQEQNEAPNSAIAFHLYALCDDGAILCRDPLQETPEPLPWKVYSNAENMMVKSGDKAPYIFHQKIVEISVSGAAGDLFGRTVLFDYVVARCEDGTIIRKPGMNVPEQYSYWELVCPAL